MAPDLHLEHLEHPSLIDVHAHARDTSDMERCSGCSNPGPNRWALTLAGLRGERWPMPADIPGRVVQARDEPIAFEFLADVTSPTELALLTGISRQGAAQRLKKRGNP